MRGIITSAMIRSACRRSSSSRASTPSPAHSTVNWCFSFALVSRRMEGSSSTKRMVATLSFPLCSPDRLEKSRTGLFTAPGIWYINRYSIACRRAAVKGSALFRIPGAGKPKVNSSSLCRFASPPTGAAPAGKISGTVSSGRFTMSLPSAAILPQDSNHICVP